VYFYNIIRELNEQVHSIYESRYTQYQSQNPEDCLPFTIDFQRLLKVVYFDGQIDAEWTEHLNVLSSDKKLHCLPNADVLDLNDFRIFFETTNLTHCSPTFVINFVLSVFRFLNQQ